MITLTLQSARSRGLQTPLQSWSLAPVAGVCDAERLLRQFLSFVLARQGGTCRYGIRSRRLSSSRTPSEPKSRPEPCTSKAPAGPSTNVGIWARDRCFVRAPCFHIHMDLAVPVRRVAGAAWCIRPCPLHSRNFPFLPAQLGKQGRKRRGRGRFLPNILTSLLICMKN